jgi:CubicO group peptidase (beta-lactamase class C family)
MQLVEQGKISLDTPLTAYLPYFHLADPRHTQITIGQMLSHISGMPDIIDYTLDKPEFDDGALERYVRSLGKESLEFDPGEKFVYSNMAYDILGQVIAEVSGQLFEDYMEEHILQPLEMLTAFSIKSYSVVKLPYLQFPELDPTHFIVYPFACTVFVHSIDDESRE